MSSAQAALFYMTTIPLGLVGITAILERHRPSARVLAGLALGIAGVAVLARGGGAHSGTLVDRLALAACGLLWAAGSLIATRGSRPRSAPRRGATSSSIPSSLVGLAWAVGDDVASVRMLVAAVLVVGAVGLTRDRAVTERTLAPSRAAVPVSRQSDAI